MKEKDELMPKDRFSGFKIPYLKLEIARERDRVRESAHFHYPKGGHWSSTSSSEKCPAQRSGHSGVEI